MRGAAAEVPVRRVALLLAALRLSRGPDLLGRMEAALAALDDGRRPRAAPPDEAGVLRRVCERLSETLPSEAAAAWEARRRAEIEACAAAAAAERLCRATRAEGAPARYAEAARAAGEFLVRLEAGKALEAGASTAGGWRVAAGLALGEGGDRLAWLPSTLWSLLPPDGEGDDGAGPVFVAAGGHAPEAWRWEEVRAELGRRRRALAAAEAFVRAAGGGAGPAPDEAREPTGGEEDAMEDDAPLERLGVRINVFGDATRVARALGLEVELPDIDCRDPAYWDAIRREGWKPKLRGKVADTEERGDPDWCTLQAHAWGRVRFDLEEGVVVDTTVGGLLPALDLVHGLSARGVPLRDADGSALVWIKQGVFGHGVPDASAAFAAAGLVPGDERPVTIRWELSQARWPDG